MHRKLECQVHESRQIGSGQTRDGKGECRHSRNQRIKWTGMCEFNSYDHYIYYCGQESHRRNGVAIMINKRVRNAVLGCNLKNDRMISFVSKAKHSISQLSKSTLQPVMLKKLKLDGYEDLQDLLELTPKKRCPFHYRGLKCKSRMTRDTWSNRKVWP